MNLKKPRHLKFVLKKKKSLQNWSIHNLYELCKILTYFDVSFPEVKHGCRSYRYDIHVKVEEIMCTLNHLLPMGDDMESKQVHSARCMEIVHTYFFLGNRSPPGGEKFVHPPPDQSLPPPHKFCPWKFQKRYLIFSQFWLLFLLTTTSENYIFLLKIPKFALILWGGGSIFCLSGEFLQVSLIWLSPT